MISCSGDTPSLYTVLPEKRVDRITGSMMASTHVYDLANAPPSGVKDKRTQEGRVELALDPSELDLGDDALAARYEQKLKEEQSHLQKEDLSDMVAEHAAKQKVCLINHITFIYGLIKIIKCIF